MLDTETEENDGVILTCIKVVVSLVLLAPNLPSRMLFATWSDLVPIDCRFYVIVTLLWVGLNYE